MNTEEKYVDLTKLMVKEYIEQNNLASIETLLSKQMPVSLLPLYQSQFGGIIVPGMTKVQYLDGYFNFLDNLREIYGIELEAQNKKCK